MWPTKPKMFIMWPFRKTLCKLLIYAYDAPLSTTCAIVHGCFERSNYSWVLETFRIQVHESFRGLVPRLLLFPFELALSLDQTNSK